MSGTGTQEDPWVLETPPGTSEYTIYRNDTVDPAELVCQVGSTKLRYLARCVDDVPAMLAAYGEWMASGSADEGEAGEGRHARGLGTGSGQSGWRLVWPPQRLPGPLRHVHPTAARTPRPWSNSNTTPARDRIPVLDLRASAASDRGANAPWRVAAGAVFVVSGAGSGGFLPGPGVGNSPDPDSGARTVSARVRAGHFQGENLEIAATAVASAGWVGLLVVIDAGLPPGPCLTQH